MVSSEYDVEWMNLGRWRLLDQTGGEQKLLDLGIKIKLAKVVLAVDAKF